MSDKTKILMTILSRCQVYLRSFYSTYLCILSKVYMLLSRRASRGTGNSRLEINAIKQVSNWRKYQLAENCPVLSYWWSILIWLTSSIPSSTAAHGGSKVKQREGFSPPIAPQRHMMLVGEDPLLGQNGSGPCSGQSYLPYFSLNKSQHPLSKWEKII